MDNLLDKLISGQISVPNNEAVQLRVLMMKERDYLERTLTNPGTTWMAIAYMNSCGSLAAKVISKIDQFYK